MRILISRWHDVRDEMNLPPLQSRGPCLDLITQLAAEPDFNVLGSEKNLERHFYRNLRFLLPDSKRVYPETGSRSVPDGFVVVGGELAPVECKLRTFDERALAQLLGYMDAYRCSTGVAVAQNLSVDLPDSIRFVKIEGPFFEPRWWVEQQIRSHHALASNMWTFNHDLGDDDDELREECETCETECL